MAAREGGRTGRRTFVEFDAKLLLDVVLLQEVVLVELWAYDVPQRRRACERVGTDGGGGHGRWRERGRAGFRAGMSADVSRSKRWMRLMHVASTWTRLLSLP